MKIIWELKHAVLFVCALIACVCLAIFHPWLWVFPVLLFTVALGVAPMRRLRALKRHGFYVEYRGEGVSFYQETSDAGIRSVQLPSHWTEVGRTELFIPTREEWSAQAPSWAMERRDEIFQRVVSGWRGFEIHYPEDWPAASTSPP
jgi:hypothetical protein